MNVIAIVFFYLVLQMCFIWIVYRLLKNPSVVDASWSIGLLMSGLIYLGSMLITQRTTLVVALLTLWALRLAGYLWYTRILQGHIDKRYTELSNNWKINQSLGFFLNFQLQGLLIFIISFIFYLISNSNNPSLTLLDGMALVIVLVGVAGESVADLQLYRFKNRQKGGVCNIGLWNYSRHPNYFFDWLTWLGFTLFAFQSNKGYLGIVSLLLLYVIFTRITGPLTERGSVQSRGQKYIDYQNQTSMFFPWFKTKIDSE
jgi:steroid 5-alpha reductase family enzyme